MQKLGLVHDTESSSLFCVDDVFGLGETVHDVPFHDSTSVWKEPAESNAPTATQSTAEVQLTASK
jgi:hypothetical protein